MRNFKKYQKFGSTLPENLALGRNFNPNVVESVIGHLNKKFFFERIAIQRQIMKDILLSLILLIHQDAIH